MERERIRDILRMLNEAEMRDAIIGGVAMGYHSIPRATQHLDVLVSREDVKKYQQLIFWLHDTLALLAMADRRYQEGEPDQGHPSP